MAASATKMKMIGWTSQGKGDRGSQNEAKSNRSDVSSYPIGHYLELVAPSVPRPIPRTITLRVDLHILFKRVTTEGPEYKVKMRALSPADIGDEHDPIVVSLGRHSVIM